MAEQLATKSSKGKEAIQGRAPSAGRDYCAGAPGPNAGILALQCTVGNRAVVDLLRYSSEPADTASSPSESNSWNEVSRSQASAARHDGYKPDQVPELLFIPATYQAKKVLPGTEDLYEQEAEQITDEVLRTSQAQGVDAVDRTAGGRNGHQKSERPSTRAIVRPPATGANEQAQVRSTLGTGQPLPPSVRNYFTHQFGYDFGHVRVHTDTQSAESANAIKARAYTVGPHVIFGAGQFAPGTTAGKRLLAHELTHVVQQGVTQSARPRHMPRGAAPRAVTPATPGAVQRKDGETSLPGNEYEFKLEHKEERWSYSLRFVISKAKTSPLTVKEDIGDESTAAGQIKAQLGASKITRTKQAGKSAANSMAVALAKADLTVAEVLPGVTIKADLKALEAKLEKGDIDVNIFKVGVMIEGQLTKAIQGTPLGDQIMATAIGERILEGLAVKIQGRFELNLDPADVVHLARMFRLNRQIAENATEAVKAKKKVDALTRENKKIRDLLKKRGSKLSKAARNQLNGRLKRNAGKVGELTGKIATNKKAAQVLQKSYQAAAKGLKTKGGRLAGAVVKKVGGKLLLKLVPGVNIITTALDIIEASVAIYKLVTGKAELGFGGDGGEGGEGAQAAETGSTDASTNVPEDVEAGEGGRDVGAAQEGQVGGGGDAGGDELELGPEIDISEEMGVREGGGKPSARAPTLHPKAQEVFDAIKSGPEGKQLGPEDLALLNELIPKDLTPEELKALIEALAQGELPKDDPLDTLGGILERVRAIRAQPPVTKVIEDGKEEVLPEGPVSPEGAKKTPGGKAPSTRPEETEGGTGKGGEKGKDAGGGPLPGEGAGKAARGKGKQGQGGGVVRAKVRPLSQVPSEHRQVGEFGFEIIAGYSPLRAYQKGHPLSLTIRFPLQDQKIEVKFDAVVESREEDDETIVLRAKNKEAWEVESLKIYMPKDQEIRLTTRKIAKKGKQ